MFVTWFGGFCLACFQQRIQGKLDQHFTLTRSHAHIFNVFYYFDEFFYVIV